MTPPPTPSRRDLIRWSAGAGAVLAFPAVLAACSSDSSPSGPSGTTGGTTGGTGPVAPLAPGGTVPGGTELSAPPVIRSEDGVLQADLAVQKATVDIGGPKPVQDAVTYDSMLPGPTWEVRPGDRLQVKLTNELPELGPDTRHSDNPNRPHSWTHTNLHTHGLHVSPADRSDNIFVVIDPAGGSHDYEILVPDDHPAGFFWYHPHLHGGVAQQVRAGLAGAIIVRGDLDEVPEIAAAKEQLLVIQGIDVDKEYRVPDPIPDPSTEEAFIPRDQILYPINGMLNPKVTMYPGEVQRWRILAAAEGKFLSLQLEGHDLHAIAWDGLTMAEPEALEHAWLSAGNRLEVLVQAGGPGTYQLLLTPGSSQHPEVPGSPNATTPPAKQSAELVTRPILTVEVTGSGPAMSLPAKLPAFDPPMRPIARSREVVYSVQRDGDEHVFDDFGVDGKAFNIDAPAYQAKLGTAEEWTVVNGTDPKLPQHAHVFHIHVNPFKVTAINGQPVARPFWRDTFVLTGTNGDSFTFQTNFEDFTGTFVQHCHVLAHEDLGMMEKIEVVE